MIDLVRILEFLAWQAAVALPERDLEVLDLHVRHGCWSVDKCFGSIPPMAGVVSRLWLIADRN